MNNNKKITIRFQIFAALAIVIFIMAAIFSPYGFYTNVSSIKKSIDERLFVAVNGLNEILPDDYHDRLLKGKVSPAEYAELQKKVSDFQKRIGVTYLYAMTMGADGKIRFSMDTEVKANEIYDDPSADTLEVFKTKTPVYAEGADDDYSMSSRTVLVPFYTPNGNMYVLGSDLNVQDLIPMIRDSLRDFFILLLIGLVLVAIITIWISKKISTPICELSNFTKALGESNFSPDLKFNLSARTRRTKEVSQLIDSIEAMRKKLSEYIANLKTEMAARNMAESELKIAGTLQESFLPGRKFEKHGLEICGYMKPAKQAGGDLYDFFEMSDGRICFAIGDVSGKGMPAALFMTRAVTLIRASARMTTDISQIANFINDMLSDSNDSCTFITFFICAYNSENGELEFVNCGHNPPYLKKADGRAEGVKVPVNKVIGVFGDAGFKSERMTLGTGETLVCYTDGVPEGIAADNSFYGDEKLLTELGRISANSSTEQIVEYIKKSIFDFERGAEQSDDITILAVRRRS